MKKVKSFGEFVNEAKRQQELFGQPEQYDLPKAAAEAFEAIEQSVKNAFGKDVTLDVTGVHKWKGGITYELDMSSGSYKWIRISEKGHIVTWPIMRAGVLQHAKMINRPFTKKDIDWFSYVLECNIDWTYDQDILGNNLSSLTMDDWAKAVKKHKLKA